MATIISVSLTKEQKEFIDEMGISASELLQRSIMEIIESSKVSEKRVRELTNNIARLQEILKKQGTFIDSHGLMEEWLTTNGY